MKKLILSLIAITFFNNSYAYNSNNTQFEFYYKGQLVETHGNFFLTQLLILPRKDMFQTPNVGVVDTFRNIFTAYETQNTQWLNKNTQGLEKDKQAHIKKFLKEFKKDDLFYMNGYAMFNKYVVIFLQNKTTTEKSIYTMELDNNKLYVPTTNFKRLYPKQYNIIEQSYKGNGELKIIKAN